MRRLRCVWTNGAEGVVVGWKCHIGIDDKLVLDVVFVRLTCAPKPVQLTGLPVNVVPISRARRENQMFYAK